MRFVLVLLISMAVVLSESSAWAQAGGRPAAEVIPGEYIVKFKRSTTSAQAHNKLMNKGQMKAAISGGQHFHISLKAGETIDSLVNDNDIEYIEPNYVLHPFNEDQPGVIVQTFSRDQIVRQSDPSGQDFGIQSNGIYDQTGAAIHADQAWARALPYAANNRPIVAVIDTGIAYTHYVFTQTNSIWSNPLEVAGNGIDDDGNGYVDDVRGWNFVSNSNNITDDQGHGTHVSGIVLGATMDILKTPPLSNSNLRIMGLKFLDSNGSGATSNAVSAIYYAVNNGAKVINCSWGGGSYSRALHEAITFAYNQGVLVVTAAGNYTSNNDSVEMYPANYDVPSNLSVAATNDSDILASFSNYGASTVHIGSPGVLVYSTVRSGAFGLMSGTSMAAPLVAGAAALALREATQLTGYQMKTMIISSGVAAGSLNGKVSSGKRIDIEDLIIESQYHQFTAASQPNYVPVFKAERGISSTTSKESVAGCGLISALNSRGPGGNSFSHISWVAILLLMPFLIWVSLRRMSPQSRRRFDRFRMSSSIKVKVGERELEGQMQTISMGGLSFNVDEALDNGGIVTMKIASPDGKELIEVQGHIVWNENNHGYGVQFDQATLSIMDKINNWTRGLKSAA